MLTQQPVNVVRLRSGIVTVVLIVLMIVITVIIFNLTYSINKIQNTNNKKNHSVMNTIATDVDTSWYRDEKINKKLVEEKNLSPVNKKSHPTAAEINSVVSLGSSASVITQANKEILEAMKAPITSNQLTDQQFKTETVEQNLENTNSVSASLPIAQDQNKQAEKSAFVSRNYQGEDEYLHSMLKNPMSPYELQAGAIIPGILITGLNSDLPGIITARVKSNIYDSISGKYILIPQGAILVGEYDARVAYGQQRALVIWKRIIYPNGQSLNLEGMSGVDMSGYAGFADQVDNHYMKLLGSVLLMSVLTSGAQLSQPQQSNNPFAGPSVGQTLAQSLGTNIANVGTAVVSKDLNIQPTIKIRPGYEFNISVKKDIVFVKPYNNA